MALTLRITRMPGAYADDPKMRARIEELFTCTDASIIMGQTRYAAKISDLEKMAATDFAIDKGFRRKGIKTLRKWMDMIISPDVINLPTTEAFDAYTMDIEVDLFLNSVDADEPDATYKYVRVHPLSVHADGYVFLNMIPLNEKNEALHACGPCLTTKPVKELKNVPRCAFVTGEFSPDNFRCSTMKKLRDMCYANPHAIIQSEEQSIVVFAGVDTRFVILEWYKDRGKTEKAYMSCENEEGTRPLSLEEANKIIARNTIGYV